MKAQTRRRTQNLQSKETKTFHAKKRKFKKGKEKVIGER